MIKKIFFSLSISFVILSVYILVELYKKIQFIEKEYIDIPKEELLSTNEYKHLIGIFRKMYEVDKNISQYNTNIQYKLPSFLPYYVSHWITHDYLNFDNQHYSKIRWDIESTIFFYIIINLDEKKLITLFSYDKKHLYLPKSLKKSSFFIYNKSLDNLKQKEIIELILRFLYDNRKTQKYTTDLLHYNE